MFYLKNIFFILIVVLIMDTYAASAKSFTTIEQIFDSQIEKATSSFPIVSFVNPNYNKSDFDAYVIALSNPEECKKINSLELGLDFDKVEEEYLVDFLNKEEFHKKKQNDILQINAKIGGEFKKIIFLNIGNLKDFDSLEIENAFKKISIKLRGFETSNVFLYSNIDERYISDFTRNAILGLTKNNFYFTLKNKFSEDEIKKINYKISKISILMPSIDKGKEEKLIKNIGEVKGLVESINLTKAFSAGPTNLVNPDTMPEMIKKGFASIAGVTIKILDHNEMKKLGMNTLLGVGLGSKYMPKLMVLEYNGSSNKNENPIIFVGKGVTFDTGGLSIKTGDHMENMKYDKSGACTAAGAIRSLASRKAKVNAVAILPIVENAVSRDAQRPDDVVLSMSGQTIDIRNTDAEGRLILADALTYAQRFYKPKLIIDIATLTGAIIVALGNNIYAGLFSNDDELSSNLMRYGEKTGERLARFPLNAEYDKAMNSKIADINNCGPKGFGAGSTTAAQFLLRFIEEDSNKKKVKWAHLDIAGCDNRATNDDSNFYGSNAFGVTLLDEFTRHYEDKE